MSNSPAPERLTVEGLDRLAPGARLRFIGHDGSKAVDHVLIDPARRLICCTRQLTVSDSSAWGRDVRDLADGDTLNSPTKKLYRVYHREGSGQNIVVSVMWSGILGASEVGNFVALP